MRYQTFPLGPALLAIAVSSCSPAPNVDMDAELSVAAQVSPLVAAPALEGVPLGASLATVQSTCKARGWTCTTAVLSDGTTRVEAKPTTTGAIERVRIVLSGGAVVSVSCRWPAPSATRYSTLATTFGPGMRGPRGETVWPLSGSLLRMGATGKSATLLDLTKLVANGLMGPGDAAWMARPRALSPAVASFLGIDPATMGPSTKPYPGSTVASVILGELPKPKFLTQGSSNTLSVKLANRGPVSVAKDVVVRARPTGYTGTKTVVGTARTPLLAPKATANVDLVVDLSKAALALGPVDLEVELDGVVYPVPASVNPQLPELEIASVDAPEVLNLGEALPVTVVVRNSSRFPTTRPFSIDLAVDGLEPVSFPGGAAMAPGEERRYLFGSLFAPAFHGQPVHVRATVRSPEDVLRFNNSRGRYVREAAVPPPTKLSISQRVPFTLAITKLRIVEENDGWFNDDDVVLQIGADTTFDQTGPTNLIKKSYDIDTAKDLAINPLKRNYLRKGEKLLFQVTALEEDHDVNELDTAYTIFDPDHLEPGSYSRKVRLQHDDEIIYDVTFAWTVGVPEVSADLPVPVHARPSNEYAYEGNYRLFVDGLNGGAGYDIGLMHLSAVKAPAYPWGRLRADSGCLEATTQLGKYVELTWSCGPAPMTLHGQLTRDAIVGTTTVNGSPRGFSLNRVL